MSSITINGKFISDMLISPKGTINQGCPVGNWWFGSSLGQIGKNNNYSSGIDNLTELLGKIERGMVEFNIIKEVDGYKATNLSYKKIWENRKKYWGNDEDRIARIVKNRFHIPDVFFDEFCQIVSDSINESYFGENMVVEDL